ncbi:SDR family NAD(P)-dependent oxidoreductase [Paraferrimonas sedimenticola]|uniref:Short-chain dehydrogenase n=1 Tax=Paraferrimonas sedimenticola TaxID=375674 RepID=A0AA37RSX0_9GAMM|nr:SDR family NAD(P)-dependent oxidoreductase [Paraferrimonas sedimenticola]GLP94731.1 short-chain dehydrogenase [Paraferrimonas sedimenticola]
MTAKTTAIIFGASSALSQELARQLANEGVRLGLISPDLDSLGDLTQQLPDDTLLQAVNINDIDDIAAAIDSLWQQLGGAHLVLVNTGLNAYHPSLPWQIDQDVIDVNVVGFAKACHLAFERLREQSYGQLAAINSVSGVRGGPAMAFHASKAFASNYLEGLRMHAQRLKLGITVSDVQLGQFDKFAQQGRTFWLSPLPVVAKQILAGLKKGKQKFHVTKRWWLVSTMFKLLPGYIYNTRRWKKKDKNKDKA